MWLTSEKDETLTLYSFSGFMIAINFTMLFAQIQMLSDFFKGQGFSRFRSNPDWSNAILTIGVTFFPLLFILISYWWAPIVVTKIDKKRRVFSVTKYAIFGKTIRRVGFDLLASFVQSSNDSGDDGGRRLFIRLEGDEVLNLSALPSVFKWNVMRTKEKANDYVVVPPKIVDMDKYGNKDSDFKLTILEDE